jgi:hypothetical protein
MTEITCRIIRADTNYRAEATQPGRVMYVAEGLHLNRMRSAGLKNAGGL